MSIIFSSLKTVEQISKRATGFDIFSPALPLLLAGTSIHCENRPCCSKMDSTV